MKADKVGLETAIQQKSAQIDGLGVSLTKEQLERQRMAAITSQKDIDISNLVNRVGILSGHGLAYPHPRFQSQYISPLTKSFIPRYETLL